VKLLQKNRYENVKAICWNRGPYPLSSKSFSGGWSYTSPCNHVIRLLLSMQDSIPVMDYAYKYLWKFLI